MNPPPTDDHLRITEDTGSSLPQKQTSSVQPLQQYKDWLHQTLNDMKEQMKKQQAQIASLQNSQLSTQSESELEVSGSPNLQAHNELI